ncbi:MAG: hypothetical protein ACK4QL_09630 [Pseudanabaenaceae cyanobacterium]
MYPSAITALTSFLLLSSTPLPLWANTRTTTGTISDHNPGRQVNYQHDRTCNQGQCQFNRVYTDHQGRTRTVNGTATTRDGVVTRRNGTTSTGSFRPN